MREQTSGRRHKRSPGPGRTRLNLFTLLLISSLLALWTESVPITMASNADSPPGTYALTISGELHHETNVTLGVNEPLQQTVVNVSPTAGSMSTIQTGQLSGVVYLQGRLDHSGVRVNVSPTGLQAITDAQGMFSFLAQGALTITAQMDGYLKAQATVKVSPGESVDLGPTTLYGGEVTGDNLIDIGDLAYLGARLNSNDLSADINGDDQVDILDLTMTAANFLMRGPTPWGE
jgi:hypothetical protein